MAIKHGAKLILAVFACSMTVGLAAAQKQEFRYSVGTGASVTIVNDYGPVTVTAANSRQVVVSAVPASNKVEIDNSQNGNRVEVRTHFLQRAGQDDGRVEYDVQVPPDAAVTVRSATGPIRVEKLRGDLALEGDSAAIDVRDISGGMLRARSVGGPITLSNVNNAYIELTSISGNITLTNVTAPKFTANATKSTITYTGNFGGHGDYSLTNHSGDINVTLPADASVDLTARSISGSVLNDFPFQPKTHTAFAADARSYAGTSNAGASVVRLRSFTGTIRVKKQ